MKELGKNTHSFYLVISHYMSIYVILIFFCSARPNDLEMDTDESASSLLVEYSPPNRIHPEKPDSPLDPTLLGSRQTNFESKS